MNILLTTYLVKVKSRSRGTDVDGTPHIATLQCF